MPTPARPPFSPAPSEWEAHRAARSGPLRLASGTVSNHRSQSRTIPRIDLLSMHQPSYSSSIPSGRVHLRRQPSHEEARMECSFGCMDSVRALLRRGGGIQAEALQRVVEQGVADADAGLAVLHAVVKRDDFFLF